MLLTINVSKKKKNIYRTKKKFRVKNWNRLEQKFLGRKIFDLSASVPFKNQASNLTNRIYRRPPHGRHSQYLRPFSLRSGNRSFVSRGTDGERSGFYVFPIETRGPRDRAARPIYDRAGEKWAGFSRDGNTGLATRAKRPRYVTPRRDFINPASISNRWPFSLTFSAHATRIKFIAIVARSRASAINRICRTLLCSPSLPFLLLSLSTSAFALNFVEMYSS